MVMTSSATALQIKWEYQSLTRVSEAAMVEALNQAGQDSWELVSASHYRDVAGMMAWTALLKRPVVSEAAMPGRKESFAAPVATPPATGAPAAAEAAEEDTEFELNVPAGRPGRPGTGSKASKLGPAKPRVEISDDFDFELAETKSAARQPTRQTKAKPAVAEADFDFELGDTFPAKLQPAKPAPPKPKAEAGDDTDFDLG
jgi:hypothetical protein